MILQANYNILQHLSSNIFNLTHIFNLKKVYIEACSLIINFYTKYKTNPSGFKAHNTLAKFFVYNFWWILLTHV